MTDIAKCQNSTCLKKEICFRQTAPSDGYWQAYGTFSPDKEGNCSFYWPIKCESCGKKGEHTEECKLRRNV